MMSGMWPHFDAVGKKCQKLYEDFKNGGDIQKYVTNGQEDKRVEIKRVTNKTGRFESSPSKSPDATLTASIKPQNQSILPAPQ